MSGPSFTFWSLSEIIFKKKKKGKIIPLTERWEWIRVEDFIQHVNQGGSWADVLAGSIENPKNRPIFRSGILKWNGDRTGFLRQGRSQLGLCRTGEGLSIDNNYFARLLAPDWTTFILLHDVCLKDIIWKIIHFVSLLPLRTSSLMIKNIHLPWVGMGMGVGLGMSQRKRRKKAPGPVLTLACRMNPAVRQ